MIVKLPQNIFYQVLFVICIIVPYFDNYEFTVLVWTFTVAITISKKYSLEFIKQLVCFAAIICIASLVMLFYKHQLYFIIRDFTYLLKPILGLLAGYQLAKRTQASMFRMIVITGAIVATMHYLFLAYAIVIKHAATVNEIREFAGYFSDFEVYALILLLFCKRFDLGFSKKKVYLLSVLIGLSIFMYMARTNFLQIGILFMAMKGYFKFDRRAITFLSSSILLAIIGYLAILSYNPKRNGDGLEALLYKIKIAPTEPFRTRINRNDWQEFNDNYRSYETITTIRQVKQEGPAAVLFGKGMGSTIDLKVKVWLGDQELRYIPIMHNGFMTIFLKSGLVGVLMLIISIRLLFKKHYEGGRDDIKQINLLMTGTGIFMIISAWVFLGLYFRADTKSILIGMFMCTRELYGRQAAIKSHLSE